MRVHVIGVGHSAGGDDAAGLAVIDALRARWSETRATTPDVRLFAAASPVDLPGLLAGAEVAIVVDAVVDATMGGRHPPGTVLEPSTQMLAGPEPTFFSSHGIDVPAALALASALRPAADSPAPEVHVVAVVIPPPRGPSFQLSASVAAALSAAADAVERLCGFSPGSSAETSASAAG